MATPARILAVAPHPGSVLQSRRPRELNARNHGGVNRGVIAFQRASVRAEGQLQLEKQQFEEEQWAGLQEGQTLRKLLHRA